MNGKSPASRSKTGFSKMKRINFITRYKIPFWWELRPARMYQFPPLTMAMYVPYGQDRHKSPPIGTMPFIKVTLTSELTRGEAARELRKARRQSVTQPALIRT